MTAQDIFTGVATIIGAVSGVVGTLLAQRRRAKNQTAALSEQAMAAANNVVQLIRSELDRVQARVTHLEQQNAEQEQELEQLRSRLEAAEAAFQECQQDRAKLHFDIETLKARTETKPCSDATPSA